MDQNDPRDEVTGAQPPADSGGADTSAWNQAPAQGQSQPAASSGQEAAEEYAAWSADASYQAQPTQPAQPADTQAYTAPQPQSATYAEQPAAQPYEQPQYYDQSAYGQQQYQQPQQQYQQPQYYDQSAYGQQYQQAQYQQPPQQYQQPPQQYQQPQYYDPNAYGQQQYQQPQYYDPNAYGQQPGYYDQNAYQQQYAQQGYAQQPAPYGYAQPGQDQWAAEVETGGYDRSFLAVLGAWVLLTWGLVWGFAGALVLYFQGLTDWLPDLTFTTDVNQLIDDVESTQERIVAFGGIVLIIGIIQVIAAVGVFGHRRWGRAFALVISILGILGALGIFTVSAGFEAMDVGLNEAIKGEEGSVAISVIVLASYLIVLLGMTVGRRHFRKRGVEA